MDENTQVGTNEQFMANVREARENGYDLVCIECGVGVNDPSDIHESRCSYFVNPRRPPLPVSEAFETFTATDEVTTSMEESHEQD